MPKDIEKHLKAKARKIGLTGDRFNKYVYGELRKDGWTPEKHRQGKRLMKRSKRKLKPRNNLCLTKQV